MIVVKTCPHEPNHIPSQPLYMVSPFLVFNPYFYPAICLMFLSLSLSLSLHRHLHEQFLVVHTHIHTYIYIYAYCWLFSYFPLYSNKIRGSEIPIQLVGDVGWAQIHQLQRPANSKDCRMVFVASHTPAVTWTRKPAMLKFLGISSLHLGCISSWKWLASVYLHIMLAPD